MVNQAVGLRKGHRSVPQTLHGKQGAVGPAILKHVDQRGSKVKQKPPRQTVTFGQLSYSNMLPLNALVELPTEKGALTKPEILERIKKLQSETKVSP